MQSAPMTVTITVAAVNDAPICTAAAVTTDEDTAVDVTPGCTDVERAALSIAIADQPAHGTASLVAGKLHYTPAAEYNGPDSFTYRASDGTRSLPRRPR